MHLHLPIFPDQIRLHAQSLASTPVLTPSTQTESTSDQIRLHVIPTLVACSVPFPLLCAPLEPVGPSSVRDQDPVLKTISNFDKSEMDKLFGEIANATSCKSTIGGDALSGDERCGNDVYSSPACRHPSYITGGIDECGYGYVPNIGGFLEASSSPVSRWSTRTLSPTIDDFAYPVGTTELSSGLAETTTSCGIAAGLVGQYGSRHCNFMGSCKHQIWEAIRASSAAPYYLDDLNQWKDGAILTNNPTIFAIREAQLLWPDAPIDCLAFESLFERLLSRNANEDKLAEKLKSIYASNSKLSDIVLGDDSPSLGWRRTVLLIESSYNLDSGKSVNHAQALETFRVRTGIKLSLTNRSSGFSMPTTSFPTPFTSPVLIGSFPSSPVVYSPEGGPQRMSRIDLVPPLSLDGHPLRKVTSPTSPLSRQPSINIFSLNEKLQSLPQVDIIHLALQNDSTGLILSSQNDVFGVPEPVELVNKFVLSGYLLKLELGLQKIRSVLQLGESREQDQKFFHNM